MRGKLRVNADHYEDNESRIIYVFSRTTSDAQKHLRPRFRDDSHLRFYTAEEIFQYLSDIYINPEYVRDARYDYNYLFIKKD